MKKISAFILAAFLALSGVASAQVGPGSTGVSIFPPGAYPFSARNAGAVAAVRAGKSTFLGAEVYNGTGATAWVQIFNRMPGQISLGSTLPDYEIQCATLQYCTAQLYIPLGISFINGLSYAVTTTEAGPTPVGNGVQLWVQYT